MFLESYIKAIVPKQVIYGFHENDVSLTWIYLTQVDATSWHLWEIVSNQNMWFDCVFFEVELIDRIILINRSNSSGSKGYILLFRIIWWHFYNIHQRPMRYSINCHYPWFPQLCVSHFIFISFMPPFPPFQFTLKLMHLGV